MDSLKVVLLADTHFGYSIGTAQAKRIVNKINAQNPDVVCIAGDIFDNEYDAISDPDELKEILSSIQSRYGQSQNLTYCRSSDFRSAAH